MLWQALYNVRIQYNIYVYLMHNIVYRPMYVFVSTTDCGRILIRLYRPILSFEQTLVSTCKSLQELVYFLADRRWTERRAASNIWTLTRPVCCCMSLCRHSAESLWFKVKNRSLSAAVECWLMADPFTTGLPAGFTSRICICFRSEQFFSLIAWQILICCHNC